VPQVHAVGYCIGGTALAALMAWLNRKHEDAAQVPVAHWTLLASLVDFSQPGEIETFINPESFAMIDTLMDKQGYLDKSQISWSFRMLRPNSLIWHYVVHKYLYGETPPAFDVLFWNSDSTRLPRAMHRFCLRNFYRDNKLPQKDALVLDDYPIDFSRVTQPLYAVGAVDDHITPWRSTFKTLGLVRGPVRYALSTSGHILGIVNPPSERSKREHWVGDAGGATDGKAWRADQTKQAGSWWGDWSEWLHARCGPLQVPPKVGSAAYPGLCAAPGTYVHET
jgi:polyhydroxyalkanoate synthase